MLPEALEVRPGYENFIARCPFCERENIYNRISDLNTLDLISCKEVSCLSIDCGKTYIINRDRVLTKQESIFFDVYALKEKKMYMSSAILLCQSLEVMFFEYIKIRLVFIPWGKKRGSIDEFNRLLSLLENKLDDCSFQRARNIFLNTVIDDFIPPSLDKAVEEIRKLGDKSNPRANEPANKKIEEIHDKKLSLLLLKLKKCEINKQRNNVVHKGAKPINCEEVEHAIEEVRELVVCLTRMLKIDGSNPNPYIHIDSI